MRLRKLRRFAVSTSQSYGQKRPPLTDILRRILEGYPDGGQILKELIQNADDAGATEVKFLYDSRENAYGTSSLITPELSKYQGPALYVHNNGLFKEQDWKGIEGIMQGNKRRDPVSVGRFGIGFNSVYHITDFPSVVSGRHVAFLDPQELYFGREETGRRFDLRDPVSRHKYRDQFAPYEDVLGCKMSSGFYGGTLFRFPLRKWPSRLSVKSYTTTKIKALFEAFIEEAPLILLFLKNVENISVYETTWNDQEKHIFSVSIKDNLKASIREMKQKFIQIALRPYCPPYEMCYEVVVEESRTGRYERERKFMILNRVGSELKRMAELSSSLHLLPWVGVATPLDFDSPKVESGKGRVFCFLPLPPESDVRTGLNVHIQASFGLTDNRRNLKWPGPECQNDDSAEWNILLLKDLISKAYASLVLKLTQSQYTAEEVIPVINSIIPNMSKVQGHWGNILEPFFKEMAEKAVFWTTSQGGRWISLNEAVLDRLADPSAKVPLSVRDVVLRVLKQAGEPVITPPVHAMKAIDEYIIPLYSKIQEITPSYVRAVLRGKTTNSLEKIAWRRSEYSRKSRNSGTKDWGRYDDVSKSNSRFTSSAQGDLNNNGSPERATPITWSRFDNTEKLSLLKFLVRDEDYTDLNGIPLLPLADKTFIAFHPSTFASNPSAAVFVASRNHSQDLMCGGFERFLDEDIDADLYECLKGAAIDLDNHRRSLMAPTQLVILTASLVPGLLLESLPQEWKDPNLAQVQWNPRNELHPSDAWLKNLWSWLRSEYPKDLSNFEGIPLIPNGSNRSDACSLIKLKKNHSVIQSSSHFASLPRNTINALQQAGCIVVPHLPSFCDHTALKQYVEPPTASGVVKVLSSVMESSNKLSNCKPEEKKAIRAFLSSLRNPSDDEIMTLMAMPVFEALDSSFTSVQSGGTFTGRKRDIAPPRLNLPAEIVIPSSQEIISASDDDSYQIFRRLPVKILNMSEFLVDKVFPYVDSGETYNRKQVSELMTWVLQRLPVLSSDNRSFPDQLKTLKFVPVSDGSFKAPCDLYDPEDETLQKLLEGEPAAFPAEEFAKTHVLSILRVFLSLRKRHALKANDVLLIAKQLDEVPEEVGVRRGKALLQFLNESSFLLDHEVSGDERTAAPETKTTLAQALLTLKWLPVCRKSPTKYPASMPWFEGTRMLYSPLEMQDMEMANLVGSVMPTLDGIVEQRLRKALGWMSPPPILKVIRQLEVASLSWEDRSFKSSEIELLKFQTMIKDIYDYLSHEITVQDASQFLKEPSFPPWVWHGTGFSKPSCVAFSTDCQELELRPYFYIISDDFAQAKYAKLFKMSGVKEKFQEEQVLDVLYMIRDNHLVGEESEETTKRDLRLARDILNHVTRGGKPLSPELRQKVLIPTQTSDGRLRLQRSDECSFCDTEWLKRADETPGIRRRTSLVHDSISIHTAELLGTPPLSRQLALAETVGFEQAGPHEPVTTRLKNILKEHKDDVGVFKELIQNADDAGATEVKFLIDWRRNPTEQLLSPGMAEAQGPALWVYNNSVFTDRDFVNINKLAGATKAEETENIGRFGLGFCSVYNLTDIPSFISREYIVFFDPQTKHLEKLIKDRSRPGIRLNLKSNPMAITAFRDQFLPYEKIFGCQFDDREAPFYYDGTLFRFPLRTMRQAGSSEISSKYYDTTSVGSLINAFERSASKLLLFVKNVRKVSFHEIKASIKDPSTPHVLFEVEKEVMETITRERESNIQFTSPLSSITDGDLNGSFVFSHSGKQPEPNVSQIMLLTSRGYENGLDDDHQPIEQLWLTSSCTGKGSSAEYVQRQQVHGLLPKAGVAALLSTQGSQTEQWHPEPVNGEAFFSLPLSIATGLPVHVNGYFAVTSNRQALWEDTGADHRSHKPPEVMWNQHLLEDAASEAYVQLLEDLVDLHTLGKVVAYPFELLWPDPSQVPSKMWKRFINSVYARISDSPSPLLKSKDRWVSLVNAVLLDDRVQKIPGCQTIMHQFGYQVVELPKFVLKALIKAGLTRMVVEHTITPDKFFNEVFFRHCEQISRALRNPIICHIIDESLSGMNVYDDMLRCARCIPTSPDGVMLASPKELIDPSGAASKLFLPEEHRFPSGEGFLKAERLVVLRKLGMVENVLSWDAICERAESVTTLASVDKDKALQRVRSLVRYLEDTLPELGPPSTLQRARLLSAKFLPVLQAPRGYSLPWQGNECSSYGLLSPSELFLDEYKFLIGTTRPLLDESNKMGCGRLGQEVSKVLGLQNQKPSLQDVLDQLATTVNLVNEQNCPLETDCLRKVSCSVYKYFQDILPTPEGRHLPDIFSQKPWILIYNKFVAANQVAFEWKGSGQPFLYGVPEEFSKFKPLFEAFGVRENFLPEDLLEALFVLHDKKQGSPLSTSEFKMVKTFLDELSEGSDEVFSPFVGDIPVPDQNLILRPVGELAIDDAPWIEARGEMNYVHADTSWKLAHKLGAQTLRLKKLDKYSRSIGKPFGQSEKLTDRLKNILSAYPCDVGILKELVQNADDSNATQIHIVFDPRHHGTTRVLSERWQDLQGPAICVYNDKPFSDAEIEGIQKLGIGSKGSAADKCGQYGVGFNAVYHLTDCPSFITDGNKLCILDPHARYAPEASCESPGRLLEPLDKEFRKDFSDVMATYLEEFGFRMKGATMFRLPVRSQIMAEQSEISNSQFTHTAIEKLLNSFEVEAKQMMLFLRNIRKIKLSRVENNRLVTKYEVSAEVSDEDVSRIDGFDDYVQRHKHLMTRKIPWYGVCYSMTLKDSLDKAEEWLIHQSLGIQQQESLSVIPEGSKLNLLPRAGVAACVRCFHSVKTRYSLRIASTHAPKQELHNHPHRAFCFLPLPVETGLPVHVNGHFALDNARRNLWRDEDGKGPRSQWNEFLKLQVVASAYAELIINARFYIKGITIDEPWYFGSKDDAYYGLKWYHGLFPSPEIAHSDWKELAVAVYKHIAAGSKPVLPIVRGINAYVPSSGSPSYLQPVSRSARQSQRDNVFCKWVPPVTLLEENEAYFSDSDCQELENLLLRLGFPLVFSPGNVYTNFREAGCDVRKVTPEAVLLFLRRSQCELEELPISIDLCKFETISQLQMIIEYCTKSKEFVSRLDGLPLLLTEDCVLRHFRSDNPVFFTTLSDLVPMHKNIFMHREIVNVLARSVSGSLWRSGVVKRFDTLRFEPFLMHILSPRMYSCGSHIPWEGSSTEKWLGLLWKLIYTSYQECQASFNANADDARDVLLVLEDWPILPTTSGTLAPLTLGKTILDLSGLVYDDKLTGILRKLGCPEVDYSMMPDVDKTEMSQILSPHLARPHSRQDLMTVLEYVSKKENITSKLSNNEILQLLRFIQEDVTAVYSNKALLRTLPFYKSLDGRHVRLTDYENSYIIELSRSVPLDEIEARLEHEGCVLLQAISEIEPLYKALDVLHISQVDVFVKYFLPNFEMMSEESRFSLLAYIRDTLLVAVKKPNDKASLLQALRCISILPDDSGILCPADRYYDPENEVFKAMLPANSFPPETFHHPSWLTLLRQVGLKDKVNQHEFIEYATNVANDAELEHNLDSLRVKSKALVEYLLQEESLHEPSFLHVVSHIKFVATERASKELRDLYVQLDCKDKDASPPFMEFHGALPCEHQKLVWTSMPILPRWATPTSGDSCRTLLENLGIEASAPLDKVIKHLENLSSNFSGNINKDPPENQRELIHDVVYDIFSFFKGETSSCAHAPPSPSCSRSCLAIGQMLQKIPCVPVEEGRVFVEGSQLAFETSVELPPYFYKVPREYGHFEHVLKRIGAEEKPTPSQFAKVLERLKEQCEDKHMEPNEQRVARLATQGLFTTLSDVVKDKTESVARGMLSSLTELFLPSKDGYLKPSNELVFHDYPGFERRAKDFTSDFVDISREGDLTADRLSFLLGLLPSRLQAKTVHSLLREEVHPSCKHKLCIADAGDDTCPFITRYRKLLLSPKLVSGILRVIKHQRQTKTVPQDVREQVHVLATSVSVTCMASLETHLIHSETGKSISNSKELQDCFLEEHKKQWQLYIRHGTDEGPLHIQLCFLVNRLIGNHIEKEIYLQAMLSCRTPEEVLPSLDRCGVAQDLVTNGMHSRDPALGTEIPVMYHYLLKQDIAYFFRQGEIVGYEKERRLPDGRIDDSEPLYVYAKIVRKVIPRTRLTDSGRFDFGARYRIDVGTSRLVEVSVLDLYKFDRSGANPEQIPVLSDSREIALFTGDPNDSTARAASRNARLEAAKKEIKEALWEAWKLPENERRKVIKRLFLRWHPDKNPGCDIANDVMQFLLQEIERMERLFPTKWREQYRETKERAQRDGAGPADFSSMFEQWNQRARQERKTYNSFKKQKTDSAPYASSSANNPKRKEARRWMRQAREDLRAAKHMLSQDEPFYSLVCFLCQQAAEKALKSALYAACGLSESQLESHDVLNLAYEITGLEDSPADIPLQAAKLKNYYEWTRYPHFHHGDAIPSEAFTVEHAQKALETAESILDKTGDFISINFTRVS